MALNALRFRAVLAAVGLMLCACQPTVTGLFSQTATAQTLDQQLRSKLTGAGLEAVSAPSRRDPTLSTLGQALFFDKILSGNRDTACASCHHPDLATGDGRSLPLGTKAIGMGTARQPAEGRGLIPRNSPEVFNRGLDAWRSMFWDSRVEADADGHLSTPAGAKLPPGVDSVLAAQAMFPVTSRDEMRGRVGDTDVMGNVNELAALPDDDLPAIWGAIMRRLTNNPIYVRMFQLAYPDTPIDQLGFQHAANAIGAFEENAFTMLDSPWDRYLAGDNHAMTESAKRGAMHFVQGGNCASCHSGDLLTDQRHHAIGVPQLGPGKEPDHSDRGRALVTEQTDDEYAFRTPPLRNVAITGPWMHDGAYVTLDDAVEHHLDALSALQQYDPSQLDEALQDTVQDDPDSLARLANAVHSSLRQPTPMTEQERTDLVAFLGSLTTTSRLDLADTIPAEVPSGLPVDQVESPMDDVVIVYDPSSGQLFLEGTEGRQVDAVSLRIGDAPDGTASDLQFRTGQAVWAGQDVFHAEDTVWEQTFDTLVDVLGEFTVHGDGPLGELLPAGLDQHDLDQHLTARVSAAGVPGVMSPEWVVVAEPSSLVLGVVALLVGGTFLRRRSSRRAR